MLSVSALCGRLGSHSFLKDIETADVQVKYPVQLDVNIVDVKLATRTCNYGICKEQQRGLLLMSELCLCEYH